MTLSGFTERVQALFPVKFIDSLMQDDDAATIPNLIRHSIEKALSKFEKIDSIEISDSQDLPQALSLVKWVPARNSTGENKYTQAVWDSMGRVVVADKVKVYFTPARRLLLEPVGTSVYVEYLVDPKTLAIEDLDDQYIQWAMKYAVALLKEKEGYLGTMAKLEALSIETNYNDMRTEGQTERDLLDDELKDMYMGTLAIRVN